MLPRMFFMVLKLLDSSLACGRQTAASAVEWFKTIFLHWSVYLIFFWFSIFCNFRKGIHVTEMLVEIRKALQKCRATIQEMPLQQQWQFSYIKVSCQRKFAPSNELNYSKDMTLRLRIRWSCRCSDKIKMHINVLTSFGDYWAMF